MSIKEEAEREERELQEHPEEHVPVAALDGAVHTYPSDLHYVVVALILGAITLVEVSTYTHASVWRDFPIGGDVLVPSLLFMMAVKFWMVTWFFMHLKDDSRLLTRVFYFGLALAVIVYLVMLLTFEFFD